MHFYFMTKDLLKSTIIAPMGTAVWLIDNTSLSFKQIGDFCDFTEAEVQLIADGVIGNGVLPVDPTRNGNLTKEEIFNREQDGKPLSNMFKSLDGFDVSVQKKKKYIPMLQRRSRPDAVLWLLNYCQDLSDAQIVKLVRTTKNMVQMIKSRTYDGYNDLVAKDPVILGFCSQRDIDREIALAKKKILSRNEQNDKKQDNQKNKEKKITKTVRKINVNRVKVENGNATEKYSLKTNKKNVGKKNNNAKIKKSIKTQAKVEKPTKKQANNKKKNVAKNATKAKNSTEKSNKKHVVKATKKKMPVKKK